LSFFGPLIVQMKHGKKMEQGKKRSKEEDGGIVP
jgi:hypothetical protein